MSTKIGFIGLGQMGKWMAINLVKAGFDITVFDLNQAAVEELVEAGAKQAANPAALAQDNEWVLLSLPNTAIVEAVIFGQDGLASTAQPGLIVCDCGTTSYLPTLDLAERLAKQGVVLVDAPVSGMEARAKSGELTIMYGGSPEVFEALTPAFNAMGNKVLNMGEVGSGQLTKLVNQLLFNISCAAIAEILPMAAKLGLDPEKVTQVVTTGTGRSFAAEFFAPLALEGVFDQGYPLKHAYKDMISAAEISANKQIPLPMTAAATTTYQMALAEGHGDLGKGAMFKVFERLLGVEFRKGR
ncbi:MAG: NAD(P)-dependent oxidoreductase [Proteobacteria bacterium]|nr:NAD(P)-dependent oxidoreductase [Pseudomonadota bacterium]MBU4276322.1 NAD(P)-dependent oxidoreductase [Pseudomonadota bacterium]MBU4383661.1 NAD(P)-dependent oxidoreductase [Pseudomonadota bacterium]MBU4606342.1 NAD(P)-dependent oxidoreductase [Pseudomonadota bacterium]MCG2763885.1 NAD(P)-dependent oxidoreductase [Desulfarculaceae bacterium]